jgi:hypothetical protein
MAMTAMTMMMMMFVIHQNYSFLSISSFAFSISFIWLIGKVQPISLQQIYQHFLFFFVLVVQWT